MVCAISKANFGILDPYLPGLCIFQFPIAYIEFSWIFGCLNSNLNYVGPWNTLFGGKNVEMPCSCGDP
jgi:hypothetical protein